MPFAKGQSGNPGGRGTEKIWRDALLKAVKEKQETGKGRQLEAIAAALVNAACKGDVAAIREIGDRLDGKPHQSTTVSGDPDNPLVHEVRETIVDPSPQS
jgi:hypothetical protein